MCYARTTLIFILKRCINKMKRQTMDWEKIYEKHMSAEGLKLRIYNELM